MSWDGPVPSWLVEGLPNRPGAVAAVGPGVAWLLTWKAAWKALGLQALPS